MANLSRRAMPFHEWPAVDQDAWRKAIADGDPLTDQGPAAHWAVATKRTNTQHYGRWLGFLQFKGLLNHSSKPADRVTRDNVRLYNQHLASIVAPYTRLSLLVGLKVVSKAMAPEHDWNWLQQVCNRVQRSARPTKDKFARLENSDVIYTKALTALKELPQDLSGLKQAVHFRDLLLLAFLAARPVRVKNMTSILLNRHLMKVDDKWLLAFTAKETKTHEPFEVFLPESLTPWLDRYLEKIRPHFPQADLSKRLWLSQYGANLGRNFIYGRIVRLTQELFGKPISPHLFRDCAATTLAADSIELAFMASRLLGHKHMATTERHYIRAKNLEASRRINNLMSFIKKSIFY